MTGSVSQLTVSVTYILHDFSIAILKIQHFVDVILVIYTWVLLCEKIPKWHLGLCTFF